MLLPLRPSVVMIERHTPSRACWHTRLATLVVCEPPSAPADIPPEKEQKDKPTEYIIYKKIHPIKEARTRYI